MHRLRRHGLARCAFRTISVVGMLVAQIAQAANGQSDEATAAVPNAREPVADEQPLHGVAAAAPDTPPAREAPQPPPPVHRLFDGNSAGEQREELSPAFVARKQYLNGFLIRDRDCRVLLSTARSALDRGDDGQAVEILQTVWDTPQDVLAWDDGRQCAVSVHRRADDLMRQTSGAARDTYERCHGGEAERLLQSVLEHHDAAAERELLRRFGHTRAAGRLLQYKALRAMDCGDLDEASGFWRRLLSDRWQHSVLDVPRIMQTLLLCEQLAANRGAPGVGIAETSALQDALTEEGGPLPASASIAASMTDSLGYPGVSPPVSEPLWARQFLDDATNHDERIHLVSASSSNGIVDELENVVGTWVARQRSHRLPMGAASATVVAGDVVIVRDFDGVTAFSVRSGDVRWRYRCESSLCGALHQLFQSDGSRSRENRRRTSEAEFFADQVADHSILSTITTDGERVYVIDGILCAESGGDDVTLNRRGGDLVLRNRLVALAVHGPQPGRPDWSRGGSDENSQSGLHDFYFLGPPRAYRGDLYLIGEQDEELQMVVLDATTGKLRWKQSISLVELPVAESGTRSRTACLPLVDQGIVVCPTQLPILIGLDAITGTLLWVYHADGEERPDSFSWPQHGGRSDGDQSTSQPVIADGRILFLPQHSRQLHCLDIRSGQKLWCVDACQARFVAGVVDGVVMLVNSQECIGLSLGNGDLQWQTPIDAPAGHGVVTDTTYLLPLNSGQIAEIRLSDGSILPNLLASRNEGSAGGDGLPDRFCGNLAIHEDLVICCSPTGLSVFPQARPLLDRWHTTRSAIEPVTPAEDLHRAELHMQLGERSAAIDVLRSLLATDPPDVIRQSSLEYLRELLYLDLAQNPAPGLEELADLVSTPHEVARYLLHRLQHELHHGRLEAAVRTTSEIRDLHLETPIRMDHDGRHLVRPLEQARFTLEQFRTMADDVERERFGMALRTRLAVDEELDSGRLHEALVLLRGWISDESLPSRLMRQLMAEGERQAAESVMLGGHLSSDAHHADTRRLHNELPRERRSSPLSPHVLPGPPPHSLFSEYLVAYRPGQETAGRQDLRAVSIREIICHEPGSDPPDDCSCSRFSELLTGRSHFLNAAGTPVRLLETAGQFSPESAGRFTVIAENGFIELGVIETTPARWQLSESGPHNAGHLVPLRGKGVLMLSLLEQRELWHVPPNPEDESQGPQLGPFGVDFCVLQSGQELTVVDPVTGRPLWMRRRLRYESGLSSNQETGIIGDNRVLVVFDADRVSHELLDTRSGARLGRGELPTGGGCRHLASFGRRLMYRTEIDGVPRIRIWDALSRRLLLDDLIDGRFCWSALPEQQRVGILTGHCLKSIDVISGNCEWELDVAGEHLEHVRKTQMFSAAGIDFVLLERHMRESSSNVSGLDIRLPSQELSGDLYAVDRASGEPLWNAPLSVHPSKVLLLPHLGLPFLVTVGRVRDQQDDDTYRLKIDVIDIQTGRIVGSQSDLTITQILHASREAENAPLSLWGPDRRIEIGSSLQKTASRY